MISGVDFENEDVVYAGRPPSVDVDADEEKEEDEQQWPPK